MNTEYIVATGLIKNKPHENTPTVIKAYFLERNISWGDGEITTMKRCLKESKLLEKGIGTVISSSDLDVGYSKIFFFNPSNYALKLPLYIRNINAEPAKNRVPEMTLAETTIINFEQNLLCQGGLEVFRDLDEGICPQNIFRCNKTENVKD